MTDPWLDTFPPNPDGFFANYHACLDRVAVVARTAEQLIAVLNEHYPPSCAAAAAFFPSGSAERALADVLREAGWLFVWSRATYYWAAQAPEDTSAITFIEGDVYRGVRNPLD